MSKTIHKLQVGGFVKIIKIPSDLTDAAEIGTPKVFARALGKVFKIAGFDRYGYVELKVGKNDTIWIEPEFVVHAEKPRPRK